jgi:hypothetical protein
MSVVLHGLSETPGIKWIARRSPAERPSTPQQPDGD